MNKKLFIFSFFCLLQNLLYTQDDLHIRHHDKDYMVTHKQLHSLTAQKDKKDRMNAITAASAILTAGILKKYTPLSLFPTCTFAKTSTTVWFNNQIGTSLAIDIEQKTSLDAFHADLQKNFPTAQFEKIKLGQPSCHGSFAEAVSPEYFGAHSFTDTIIINFPAINFIDSVYTKQRSGQPFTQEEKDELDSYKWTLLHESAHIRHNDTVNGILFTAATTAGLEALRYAYRSKNPITRPKTWKNLPLQCGKSAITYSLMATTVSLTTAAYSRYYEKRADAFANQHATDNQLTQARKFFTQYFLQKESASTTLPLLATHPSTDDRILAIDQEIQRRQQK